MADNLTSSQSQRVRIWDIWIRLFHWTLAFAVVFLLISGTTGWQFYEWHRNVGEAVLALILFRLCWGVVGSGNARLLPLLASPFKAMQHLGHVARGNVEPERGHNAAGGWAVLGMLLLILFQAVSGLFIADEDELQEGAFYGVLSSDASDRLMQLHYLNADILKAVIALHLIMVLIYAIRASQNLFKPMVTGWINWPADVKLPAVFFQRFWVGLLLIVLCLLLVGRVLSWWG